MSAVEKFPQEPSEGSRATIDRELERPENNRESGARKHEERPEEPRNNPVHTGDRGDEPPSSQRGENPIDKG